MCQLDRLQRLRDEIYQIVRKHKAEKLYVFGSCARKEETPKSDIDFIADFKDHASIFDHAGLEYDLSRLLGCKVDVVACAFSWRRSTSEQALSPRHGAA